MTSSVSPEQTPYLAPAAVAVGDPSSAPTDDIVVYRDRRRHLRLAAIWSLAAGLALFGIPALVVLLRREPGYFTQGMLLTALIGIVLSVLIGVGGTLAWLRTGNRAAPLMTLTRTGIVVPATKDEPAVEAPWERIDHLRLIGHTSPELAIHLRPDEAPAAKPDADTIDLSEPEFLRPLDFQNDPPPPTAPPTAERFAQLVPPAPADEDEPEVVLAAAPRGEALYGTTHVVPLAHTNPSLIEVVKAIREYSAGRVPLG